MVVSLDLTLIDVIWVQSRSRKQRSLQREEEEWWEKSRATEKEGGAASSSNWRNFPLVVSVR
jgi:hypothetical protein